jgi:DNA-binding GntR family transcriptional regulator
MLGVSRGTLRTALQRLETTGEIVRRQGSGTFVGSVALPSQLGERLERLEPYSSLASRRGVKLAATRLKVEVRTVGREVCELLDIDAGTQVTTVFRVLVASGQPAAVMFDVVHPSVALPDPPRLLRMLEGGQMVLDVLVAAGIPVAFAQTHVMPALVTPREEVGKALQIRRTTAALELEEVMYVGASDPVAYARDLFAPGALDVRVMRSFEAASPVPIMTGGGGRRARVPRRAR